MESLDVISVKNTRAKSAKKRDPLRVVFLLPDLITMYLQLFYNIFVVFFMVSNMQRFMRTLERDLNRFLDEKMGMAFAEIFKCSKEFVNNGCANNHVAPALEEMCDQWRTCMNQEPNVMTTKASVEIFADIINNFCNNLTDRTLFCIFGMTIVSMLILNFSLNVRTINKQKVKT